MIKISEYENEFEENIEEGKMEKLEDEVRELSKKIITPYNFPKIYEMADRLTHVMDEGIENHWSNMKDDEAELKIHHKRIDINNPVHKKSPLWDTVKLYRKMIKDLQTIVSHKDNQIQLFQNLLNQIASMVEEIGDVNTEKVRLESREKYAKAETENLQKAVETLDSSMRRNYERVIQVLEADIERLGNMLSTFNVKSYQPIKMPKEETIEEVKEKTAEPPKPSLKKYVNKDKLDERLIDADGDEKKACEIVSDIYDEKIRTKIKLAEVVDGLDAFLEYAIEDLSILSEDIRRAL